MSVEVDGPRFKEIEIMAAEMETRLRDSVLRVLRPTLAQVSELEGKQKDLLSRVEEQNLQIAKVDGLESNVLQQNQFAKILEDVVTSTANQVQELEAISSKQFVELKSAFEASQMAVNVYKNDVLRLSREDTRIWDETTRLQQQHDEDVRTNRDNVNGCHKRIARVREEFEGHILVINKHREQLMEDLWGEGRGLNQLNRDLKQLNDFVSPIPEMMRQIAANERAVKTMAKRQEAFEQEFVQNRGDWQEYVRKQDVAMVEMKNDFKRQCNHLVAHNAEIMKDIRRDYTKEIEYIQETRLGIAKTLEQLGRTLADMEEKLAVERRRIDVIHHEITKEIEDLQRWRNSDRVDMMSDIHQFRTDLKQEKDGRNLLCGQVDNLKRLTGLMLEGCRVGSALSLQDFADRGNERWLFLTGEQIQAVAPFRASDLEKQRQRREDPRMREDPITDLKGRGGLVRTGYQPGQILFSGQHFDRCDLLILQGRLLQKAQQAYTKVDQVDEEGTEQPLQLTLPPKWKEKEREATEAPANATPRPEEGRSGPGYPAKVQRILYNSPRASGRRDAGDKGGKSIQLDGTKLPAIHSARREREPPKVATPPLSRPGTSDQ